MTTNDEPLFLRVKAQIYAQILDGHYVMGQRLPTESALCSEFEASRVTIRKALDELKEEGVISSVQGQGTVVTLGGNVSKNSLDTIALIASGHDFFLGQFLDTFDQLAAKEEALVIYKSDSDPYNEKKSNTFRHLHTRSVRNFVLWPNQGFHNEPLLERLRLLGINLVFFDHIHESAFADCVTLDNVDAIQSLYKYLRDRDLQKVNYIGWSNVPISSTDERNAAFEGLNGKARTIKLFERCQTLEIDLFKYVQSLSNGNALPDAFLCGNGDLACGIQHAVERLGGSRVQVVSVDAFPRKIFPDLVCYDQPMKKMAKKCFTCLVNQNDPDREWQSKTYRLKGKLLV